MHFLCINSASTLHRTDTGAIRVEIELLFFDPVLYVVAGAVDFVVEPLGVAVKKVFFVNRDPEGNGPFFFGD